MRKATIGRDMMRAMNGWTWISLIGAAVVLLPLLTIFGSLFSAPNENWNQTKRFLFKDYVIPTIGLVGFTVLFAVLIGISFAWLIAAYDFPLKRFFRWALLLPLAVPPYIAAYTYGTMLSYTGIVQKTLRNTFGITPNPAFFDILSFRGAVFIFTLFLYPYVYMIARPFFERQSSSYMESARLLGRSPSAIFWRVMLPLARPAIIGGGSLVAFEVMGDYGVTKYYGIHTVTTAIFQTWFGMYDVQSAMRLAAWLIVMVVGLLLLERLLRQGRAFHASTSKSRPLTPSRLKGFLAAAAMAACFILFLVSFAIPNVQMLAWAWMTFDRVWTDSFTMLIGNTVSVAFIASSIAIAMSVIIAYTCRMQRSAFSLILTKSVTAGYSIPGTIVAVGVLALFIGLDRVLDPLYASLGLGEHRLVLSLSIVMLAVAYVVRFMAVGYNAVEAGLARNGTRYSEAARMLGSGMTGAFFRVELHLLKGSITSGFLLIFVEIIKELPLALLLRPFNFDTLATKMYQYAGDEMIYEAALPSLLIVGISTLSVIFVHLWGKKVD